MGILSTIKDSNWKVRNEDGSERLCPPTEKPHDDLDIGNVGGVFLVRKLMFCFESSALVSETDFEHNLWNDFTSVKLFSFQRF